MADPVADEQAERGIKHALARPSAENLSVRYPGVGNRAVAGLQQALLSVAAAVMAWWPTQALGLREGFWSAITAIAVAQTELNAAGSTGRDQFLGALVGGSIATGVSLFFGHHSWNFAIAVGVSIYACWLLNIANAARLAGITSTIIFLIPGLGSAEHMMVSRLSEVAWGTLMAFAVVWTADRSGAAIEHLKKSDASPR